MTTAIAIDATGPTTRTHADARGRVAPATRTWRDDLGSLPAALRSERIKLLSLRSTKVVAGLAALSALVGAYLVAVLVHDEVLIVAEVFVFPAILVTVLTLVSSVLLITAEAEHGTLAAALTARPTRWVLALGKATTAVALAIALATIGMVAGAAGAILGGLAFGDRSAMAATALWCLLYTALSALLGLAIGTIVRHSAAAISGLLVWWFVAENLLRTFAPVQVARFLPLDAGYRVLEVGNDFDSPELIAAALTRVQYGLVFAGYTAVALAVAGVLLQRRDVD
jgi:ABC-type transport system involved in multi-copper enzyme maturation permease subunit